MMHRTTCVLGIAAASVVISAACGIVRAQDTDSATSRTNSVGMTLRLLPAGEFLMGSPDDYYLLARDFKNHALNPVIFGEEFRHRVRLTRPLYMAATEVTVAQFRQFLSETKYRTTPESSGVGMVGFIAKRPDSVPSDSFHPFDLRREFSCTSPGFSQADDHPVVGISWHDAVAFCKWLSEKESRTYRLPTEAEWEYACRAGSKTWFSFGDKFRKQIHKHANVANVELERRTPGHVMRQWLVDVSRESSDGHAFTAPVASFKSNAWGLYDMHGNVWEWCADEYLDTAYQAAVEQKRQRGLEMVTDPIHRQRDGQPNDRRVIRGGSWANSPFLCRSAMRGRYIARDAACYLGFRVVCEVE